jgi:hypothetical protein
MLGDQIESGSDPTLPREKAVDGLAECLYLKMERMDPERGTAWADLDESVKDYYRASIREILLEKTLLALAMGVSNEVPTTT